MVDTAVLVKSLRKEGKTQEQIAKELNIRLNISNIEVMKVR